MKLILIRHGETDWNLSGRFQGVTGTKLNQSGIVQAHCVSNVLQSTCAHSIYSSPLTRAMEMSEIISQALSISIVSMTNLQELNLGELEGITGNAMKSKYPEIYSAWGSDPSTVSMPGGESLQQLQTRAWNAVETIKAKHTSGTSLVVSHNFAIVCIICKVLGVDLSRFHQFHLDLGSLTTIEFKSHRWNLISFNDHSHLNI